MRCSLHCRLPFEPSKRTPFEQQLDDLAIAKGEHFGGAPGAEPISESCHCVGYPVEIRHERVPTNRIPASTNDTGFGIRSATV